MGTLGKALGTFGAFIAGSELLIEALIQLARPYIYTTALPPPVAAATRRSLQLVVEEPWRRRHLQALIAQFRQGAEQLGLQLLPSETAIQPILVGADADALAMSQALRPARLLGQPYPAAYRGRRPRPPAGHPDGVPQSPTGRGLAPGPGRGEKSVARGVRMRSSQVYPALTPSASDPIVLLHGWGFDRASMAPLVEPLRRLADVWCVDLPGFGAEPPLAQAGLEALTGFLAERLPPRACLVGWSLGGVLALAYAHRYGARVSAVASLACNAKFVATEGWPCAMASEVNRRFNRSFAADPEATVKRFCALVAQGSPDARAGPAI